MSKHTPGPWKVTVENDDSDWAIVTGKGGNIVANVNSETGPDLPPLVSTKMPQRANARLIAAAPDLLETAMEIKRLIDEYAIVRRDGCLMGTAEAVTVGLVFGRVDAAIAKATGDE